MFIGAGVKTFKLFQYKTRFLGASKVPCLTANAQTELLTGSLAESIRKALGLCFQLDSICSDQKWKKTVYCKHQITPASAGCSFPEAETGNQLQHWDPTEEVIETNPKTVLTDQTFKVISFDIL